MLYIILSVRHKRLKMGLCAQGVADVFYYLMAGDPGSIPGSGRSPGERHGNPLQYSCLENPMDGGVWYAAVRGVVKSRA